MIARREIEEDIKCVKPDDCCFKDQIHLLINLMRIGLTLKPKPIIRLTCSRWKIVSSTITESHSSLSQ